MNDEEDNFLLDLLEPFKAKMGRRGLVGLTAASWASPAVWAMAVTRLRKARLAGTIAVREPHRLARRCVVKGRYGEDYGPVATA